MPSRIQYQRQRAHWWNFDRYRCYCGVSNPIARGLKFAPPNSDPTVGRSDFSHSSWATASPPVKRQQRASVWKRTFILPTTKGCNFIGKLLTSQNNVLSDLIPRVSPSFFTGISHIKF